MDRPLSEYIEVVELSFDNLSEEEIEAVWDRWKLLYLRYRKKKEGERGER